MKSHLRSDNLIGDYCDAELCKSIPLFNGTDSDNSLQIIMYFDELESCNPLGGQAGIHKLGNFYCINIHTMFRGIFTSAFNPLRPTSHLSGS